MIALAGCVLQRGGDIAGFEQRIIVQNFFPCRSRGQQIKHILNPNTQRAQAGLSEVVPENWTGG